MNFKNIFALTKSELRSQFVSPVIYVFIIVFLILHGFFTLRMGGFFDGGEASLDGAFFWHPWLYLILVPAVGMHLWSDERRDGTLELLFTYPVTVTEAVLGKYFASLVVLFISLAGTFPLAATVFYLGSPDPGPMICGYLGSFLIAASFLAVTCFTSSLTRSPVVSFVLSLTICLFLNFAGWGPVLEFLRGFNASSTLIEITAGFSCITHFENLQRGMLQLSDIVYFITTIVFFLTLNGLVLDNRRNHRNVIYAVVAVTVIALAINALFAFVPFKFDCTAGKIYSLSAHAEKIFKQVKPETPVAVTFYFSETHPDMPPVLKSFASRVWTLLEQVASMNPNIRITKINPLPDSEAEDNARANGVTGSRQPTGESVYCGVAVKCIDNLVSLPALTPDQEPLLEYQIAAAVSQVSQADNRRHIGLLSSLPLLEKTAPDVTNNSWTAFMNLDKNYHIEFLTPDPSAMRLNPDSMPVVILVHPVNLSLGILYELDQYVLRGGKLICLLDAYPFAAAVSSEFFNAPSASRLEPLLKSWGVTMTPMPVTDLELVPRDRNTGGVYIQSLPLGPKQVNADLTMTHGIAELNFFAPAGFLYANADSYRITSLVHTTGAGVMYPLPMLLEKRPIPLEDLNAKRARYHLALDIRGPFKTAFPQGRPKSAEETDVTDILYNKPVTDSAHLMFQRGNGGEVVLVGDVDFLSNQGTVRKQQTAFGVTEVPINDNIYFFQNIVDILSGDPELVKIRVKPPSRRPLERIDAMMREAAEKRQSVIQKYEMDLNAVMQSIEDMRRTKDGKTVLNAETEAKIVKLESERRHINDQLKLQRRELRRDIDALQLKLEIFNIVLIPLLLSILGASVVIYRYKTCGAK